MPSGAFGTERLIADLKSVSGLCAVVMSNVADCPGNRLTNAGSTLTVNGATPVIVGIDPNETALWSSALCTPGERTLSHSSAAPLSTQLAGVTLSLSVPCPICVQT